MDGFCTLEVNPLGPAQLYVALATVVAFKFKVAPAHIGLLLVATGTGAVFTITSVVPGALGQLATVIITEYVPEAAEVAPGMEGFCKLEVNPLGPVQA